MRRQIALTTLIATAVIGSSLAPLTASASPAPTRDVAPVTRVAYSIKGTIAGKLTREGTTAKCAGSAKVASATSTSECEVRVVAILPDGRAFGSAAVGSNGFSIAIAASASARANLTLHLVRANGAYVGPVVLDTESIKEKQGKKKVTKYVGAMSLGSVGSAASTNLGGVTLKEVSNRSAFAVAGKAPKTGSVTAFMCEKGVPYGAGKAGYVEVPSRCKPKSAPKTRSNPRPRDDMPQECQSFFDSQGANPMSLDCWNALAGAFGTDFTGVCPKNQTANKKLSQMPAGCQKALQGPGDGGGGGGGGGDNNGGGSDDCSAQSSGGDQDGDGIPSAVDVDDNGNGIVDLADQETSGGCTVEPYKGVMGRIGESLPVNYAALNAGLFDNRQAFDGALDELLASQFYISYYVFDERFFPGALKVDGVIPAVWVTCTGVIWCDPTTSKAVNYTNVEQKNAVGVTSPNPGNQNRFEFLINEPWASQDASSWCEPAKDGWGAPCWSAMAGPMRFGTTSSTDCQNLAYEPNYEPQGVPGAASNFLWQTVCQENGRLRAVNGASLKPQIGELKGQSGVAILSGLDLLTLNYASAGGGVSGIATTLGSYPITTPMVAKLNTVAVDYASATPLGSFSNRVQLSAASPNLRVEFYRPQREQFPGEAGSTGFHDMYNLSYGLEFMVGDAHFGCGASTSSGGGDSPDVDSAYDTSGSSQWTTNAMNGEYAWFLAPLRDAVEDSPTAQPASQTLTMKLNVVKCIQDRAPWLKQRFGVDVADFDGTGPDGPRIEVNLTARGESKTGGTDTARQSFALAFAEGTFQSVSP